MSDYTPETPYGYCHCGCGQKTTISFRTGKPCLFKKNHETIAIKFWSKVNKDGSIPTHMPHLGQCWEWIGSVNCKWGYGQFGTKRLRAHRVAWVLTNGEITNNLHVLHKCDNRLCCNPEHLFLGTQQDNIDDKVSKGRQPKGETNGGHILTSQQVNEIRQRYMAGGITQYKLADEYGVRQTTISAIITRTNWKD